MEITDLEFVGNYRGWLQIARDGEQYYWRVESEIDEEEWLKIDEELYLVILKNKDKYNNPPLY